MNAPTEFAPRAPDVEADHLSADLLTVMRMLQRMRPDLHRHHAWLHAEAACQELQKARTRLKRANGEGSTEEI